MSSLDKYSSCTYHFGSKYIDAIIRKRSTTINKSDIDIQNFYEALVKLIQQRVLIKYALGFFQATVMFKTKYNMNITVVETDSKILVWSYFYIQREL